MCETLEQLNEREKFWIAKYNSIVPNGYNMTEGGSIGIPGKPKSDATRARMKLAQAKNRKCVRCIETGGILSDSGGYPWMETVSTGVPKLGTCGSGLHSEVDTAAVVSDKGIQHDRTGRHPEPEQCFCEPPEGSELDTGRRPSYNPKTLEGVRVLCTEQPSGIILRNN